MNSVVRQGDVEAEVEEQAKVGLDASFGPKVNSELESCCTLGEIQPQCPANKIAEAGSAAGW